MLRGEGTLVRAQMVFMYYACGWDEGRPAMVKDPDNPHYAVIVAKFHSRRYPDESGMGLDPAGGEGLSGHGPPFAYS